MVNDATVQRSPTPAQRQATIDKSLAKAHEQARIGNLPNLLRTVQALDDLSTTTVWTIGSRTTGGVIYCVVVTADADGLASHCECESAHAGRVCWHRAAARLAVLGEIASHDATRPQPVTAAELSGHPANPYDEADWLN